MSNPQHLDELFNQAKQLPSVHAFSEVSARFVESKVSGTATPGKRKRVSTKNVLIMLVITGIVLMTALFSTTSEEHLIANKKTPLKSAEPKVQSGDRPLASTEREAQTASGILLHSITQLVDEASFQAAEAIEEKLENESSAISFPVAESKVLDDVYPFPKLTEEEIAANNRQKKAMLRALEKFDKKQYVYVPSGSFAYEEKMVSVQAFYMQRTEVSNLEYRTFLFDLLIHDRKADFLKAKPDQTQWVAAFNSKPFEEYYFSHKAYDDYPVVNVSQEGAEMYCKWLSEELHAFVGEKKANNYNDIRLPQRMEWVKAASNEGQQLPYPWDGQYMRNSEGLYQANFTVTTVDTAAADWLPTGSDLLAPVRSYFPNALGLYNMSGNAAELVYESEGKGTVGTAGGSWRQHEEELKILAPDPYKGKVAAMPTIGFRVVMTYIRTD